jgi:hypothetical protein
MESAESSIINHGEVFTKPAVVQLMLIISGLHELKVTPATRILEPSCGRGDFVILILDDLLGRADLRSSLSETPEEYLSLITAFDLQAEHVETCRRRIVDTMVSNSFSLKTAKMLSIAWVKCADFLLVEGLETYDLVIGNPPYVRIEEIEKRSLALYRASFSTMVDRADLYVPFFEKSLDLLKSGGKLCFICTDRWIKNRYGRMLREKISKSFGIEAYIDFYGVDAFQSSVVTYPAVTLISRGRKDEMRYYDSEFASSIVAEISPASVRSKFSEESGTLQSLELCGQNPWLIGQGASKQLIERFELTFGTLADAGCKVHIGAATGSNKVFLVGEDVDVEMSRMIPCVTSRDFVNGELKWSGKFMINPWDSSGLVSLKDYPKLARYLDPHRIDLSKRHTAKKNPSHWYKTIDRIYPDRAFSPKLFIPDIKDRMTVIFDDGKFHANNSLYFILSDFWNPLALRAVLMVIGPLFIRAYSTRVAGGHLRFQAQHLRRIRIPQWSQITQPQRRRLEEIGKQFEFEKARNVVGKIFSMSSQEMNTLNP